MEFNITLLPGDGIGPEVVYEAVRVLDKEPVIEVACLVSLVAPAPARNLACHPASCEFTPMRAIQPAEAA